MLACCGLVLLSAASPAVAEQPGGDTKAAKPAKPALEKGMSAEAIIKLIGKPAEVKPIPVPEGETGKAETWIYRRDLGTRSIHVPIGTREVPAFAGIGVPESRQVSREIIYGMKTVRIYQVTSLLMFDGKLVVASQTQEKTENY